MVMAWGRHAPCSRGCARLVPSWASLAEPLLTLRQHLQRTLPLAWEPDTLLLGVGEGLALAGSPGPLLWEEGQLAQALVLLLPP